MFYFTEAINKIQQQKVFKMYACPAIYNGVHADISQVLFALHGSTPDYAELHSSMNQLVSILNVSHHGHCQS